MPQRRLSMQREGAFGVRGFSTPPKPPPEAGARPHSRCRTDPEPLLARRSTALRAEQTPLQSIRAARTPAARGAERVLRLRHRLNRRTRFRAKRLEAGC